MTIVIAIAFILYSIPVYFITSVLVIISKFSKRKYDDNNINSIEEAIDKSNKWEEEQIEEYGDFREYRNK